MITVAGGRDLVVNEDAVCATEGRDVCCAGIVNHRTNCVEATNAGLSNVEACVGNGADISCWSTGTPGPIVTHRLPWQPDMVSRVFGGSLHHCALSSGEMFCWGANESRIFGESPGAYQSQPVKICVRLREICRE